MLLEDYTVASLMRIDVPTVAPDRPLVEALELLDEGSEAFLVAIDGDVHPVGILTEGDALRLTLAEQLPAEADVHEPPLTLPYLADAARLRRTLNQHVRGWMTAPVATAQTTDSLERVVEVLTAHNCRQLPVVREGALIGVVRRVELFRPIARLHRAAAAALGVDE